MGFQIVFVACTICPRSSDPFYIVTYCTTSWTHSIDKLTSDKSIHWFLNCV